MDRREVLKLGLGFAIASMGETVEARRTVPIIDTHIHLFDPTRAGGVPWPSKDDAVIYKPALPSRYEQITRTLGIVGAIVIEASPLESDNDWVLQQAADHPIVIGLVGNLIPGDPSYGRTLDRLNANPLFVGIRYGNLWDRDLSVDRRKPGFVSDLRKLASARLALDSANPDPKLIRAILEVAAGPGTKDCHRPPSCRHSSNRERCPQGVLGQSAVSQPECPGLHQTLRGAGSRR